MQQRETFRITPAYVLLDAIGTALAALGISMILGFGWVPEPLRSETFGMIACAAGLVLMSAPVLIFLRRKREQASAPRTDVNRPGA